MLAAEVRHPVPPDAARIARLIDALGADEFADRETAVEELAALGRAAEAALWKVVTTSDSPEVRERAGRVIRRLDRSVVGEDLRTIRAVEAVEWVATSEAVQLLERWAAGPDGSRLATEARAALARVRAK
jgi:hypothetical protein